MDFKEIVYLASKYAEKGLGYEDLMYGDDLYHLDGDDSKQEIADSIWDLVIEYKEEGSWTFSEKYKDYKLY